MHSGKTTSFLSDLLINGGETANIFCGPAYTRWKDCKFFIGLAYKRRRNCKYFLWTCLYTLERLQIIFLEQLNSAVARQSFSQGLRPVALLAGLHPGQPDSQGRILLREGGAGKVHPSRYRGS